MARKEPTRSIRLSAGAKRPPGSPPDDDVGRALADISANAEIRNRDQLPSRVKVITPHVIMNIVTGITDKLGMEVDREEFNDLVMQQTQMEMQLRQAQDKVEQYKGEYKKVYEAWQQTRETLQQAQSGDAGVDDVVQQYEAQIGELQQRNADAVDIYMDLQRQLDDTTEQYSALEQQMRDLQAAAQQDAGQGAMVAELQQQVDALQQQIAQLESASAQAGEESAARAEAESALQAATERVQALEAELDDVRAEAAAGVSAEALQVELDQVKRQLKEAQASRSKLENVETELEQLRAAEGAWLEEKRRMASQLSNETNNRRTVEQKLEALQSGAELPPAAKLAQAKAKEVEAELGKVRGELAKLEQDLAKSGNAAKELGVLKRKFEGVESELETLRAAEGKWLEEKRRMAAQLSNETNLRRDLEEKFKGEVAEAKAETASVKKKSKK
jgi:chromosome segregation ATPase